MRASVKPHYEYARYIVDHGSADEKKNLKTTLGVMNEVLDSFPGGDWEPMECLYMIDSLLELAEQVATKRWRAAHRQHYHDYQGKVGRSFEEERQTVRGHLCAQIMLGLPLGKPDSKEEARTQGNIGAGNEAFIPLHNPVGHNLIVDPRTQDHIASWLVVPEGERHFRLAGWIRAGDAKQDLYRKERQREGGISVAYWVPPKELRSVRDWWAETHGETWPEERHDSWIEISRAGVTKSR